jgi:transcriptional regulator with XRE-family HTH domain
MKQSVRYRRAYERSLQQIDLAMLVREMREAARLSQQELAERAGTTQSVIARLEDAEYTGHSLRTLERIAAACGVNLKLRAPKSQTSSAN